tara:strand:+ start:716 stop:1021 length:306 start_codon:yes stop_codon:yes gene_type:complete
MFNKEDESTEYITFGGDKREQTSSCSSNMYKRYLTAGLTLIPVVSSAICAVYVILMYNDVHNLITSGTDAINTINTTNINSIVDGLGVLEKCVLTKLPICS